MKGGIDLRPGVSDGGVGRDLRVSNGCDKGPGVSGSGGRVT